MVAVTAGLVSVSVPASASCASPPPQLHPAQSPPNPPAAAPFWRLSVLGVGVAVTEVIASTSEAALRVAGMAGGPNLGVDQSAAALLLTVLCVAGTRLCCMLLLLLLLLLLLVLLPACS